MDKKKLAIIIGVAVVAVVVVVLLNAALANHRPTIAGLEAPGTVAPRGWCQIVCNASDRDGDVLSYNWSATGGNISGTGMAVNWTAPSADGSYNVTVIVSDSRGGTVTDYVTITARHNKSPTINNLTASSTWTLPSGSLNVTCDASDPDRDELSYEWTATGGDVSGTGAAVSWAAPQEFGVYNVTVVVKDGYGSEDTRFISLSVVSGEPPTIETLVVTAEHCYLKTNASGYLVGQGKNYSIQCSVADTGMQLSYEWSCGGGEIADVSEDGSRAVWTAPKSSVKVTITVIVSNIADKKAARNLLLDIVGCSPCTFRGCSE
jgi:hypothetical protein